MWITETESEVFLNKHALSAFCFLRLRLLFKSRLNDDVGEVVCWEFLWYGLIIAYYATFFHDSVKLFQEKALGKSVFVIKNLNAPWLRE